MAQLLYHFEVVLVVSDISLVVQISEETSEVKLMVTLEVHWICYFLEPL